LRSLDELEKILFEYGTSFPPGIVEDPNILLEIGKVWFQLGNYTKATDFFLKLRENSNDPYLIDNSLMLEGVAFSKQYNWEKAQKSFELISHESFYKEKAESNIQILNKATQQKYKSATLGGILGIVPGAGYLYAEHRQTAVSSLIINSLFIFASYSTFKSENYGLGALVSVFSVSFYIGNISGSVKSVKRLNKNIKENFALAIERKSNLN